MNTSPITLSSFPAAILHIDADAFFTSVEQAVNPALKGRPMVTGKERGIIACASYEAKARGIKRGVSLWDARRICPNLVVLPSDYETYSIYSRRMFDIARRYTPVVEEYSIDEAFADITGMRRVFHCSYENIARRIQQEIYDELDLTVSIGLSLTKSLAKLGSDFRKPRGFTPVRGRHIHLFLARIPLEDVWGIGPNSSRLLRKYGLSTALDLVNAPEIWIRKLLGKPGTDIWNELRGKYIYPVCTDEKSIYASIGKGKTFTSPSDDRDFIYAKLIRNIESAFIKLRRHNLQTGEMTIALRTKDYHQDGLRARLNRPTDLVHEVIPVVQQLFNRLYRENTLYRTTQVVLGRLDSSRSRQYELFEDILRIERCCKLTELTDQINCHFGKHKLCLGTGLHLNRHPVTERDQLPWRKQHLLPGETDRQRLAIPRIDVSV
jgi:DNA polymerase-4/DNA polymerase V